MEVVIVLADSASDIETADSDSHSPEESSLQDSSSLRLKRDASHMWVVVKTMVPFWVPEILGAVLY